MVSNVASQKEGPEFDTEDHFYIAEFYCTKKKTHHHLLESFFDKLMTVATWNFVLVRSTSSPV